MGSETRSDEAVSDAEVQVDLFGHPVHQQGARTSRGRTKGVGGRQPHRAGAGGGGGYLDGRTASEVRADPRLRELAEIGLSATWLGIAQLLGYDLFVAFWRQLSADPALRDDDNQIEIRLRPVRSYERYQRNRYIDTLVASGLKPSQIRQMLKVDLNERLSPTQIRRLTAASRSRV